MCKVFVLKPVPIITAGSALQISAAEDTKGRWAPFVCLMFFSFPHTVGCHQSNRHPICSSAGPGPRRWPSVGSSNGAGMDRHSLAMLPKEAEVGALGDEEGQRISTVQKEASPHSRAVVAVEGIWEPPFSYSPHQPFQSSPRTTDFSILCKVPLITETSYLFN